MSTPPCSARARAVALAAGDERVTIDPEGQQVSDLVAALAPYGIGIDRIPIAFNVVIHVALDATTDTFTVLPPLSKVGDFIHLQAERHAGCKKS